MRQQDFRQVLGIAAAASQAFLIPHTMVHRRLMESSSGLRAAD